ncbi:hypothetical protein CFN78_19610 [Amycolatopsis antarctica]|uniref:Dipeptidylpeptidase IV N-terminal domain-containing protein n=1 Tax=Amycolatopsis antarctica TaxID=1854586 RepID=A0A263D201_9PSEU|nr:PD40 domain-containing protein [Amycolatopsis antarctica]OZM71375.1 hypothetical protein CFN78_19610 [Amycolatopsis antarctica]
MRRVFSGALAGALALTAAVLTAPAAGAATNGPIHFGQGYTINPDGTGLTGPNPNRSLYSDYLAFSPDGSRTLYRGQNDAGDETKLMLDNPAFTAPTELLNSTEAGKSFLSKARWSPDGEQIAFRAADESGSRQIGLIAPDGSGLSWLVDEPRIDVGSVSWLPDSSGVVYTATETSTEPSRLCQVRVADSAKSCVPLPDEGANGENFYDNAEVSPDGESVLLSLNTQQVEGQNTVYDVVKVSIDGTGFVNLSQNEADQSTSFAWSPDGSTIAFSRYQGLWTIGADGTGKVRISENSADNIAWQPAAA